MGILSGIFKARDMPTNATAGSAYRFLFGGSASGKAVTERSAMQMTAVYSCVRILAEAVADLPLHVYRYTDTGGKETAIDHPLYTLLHDEPNPEMTSFVFRETLMKQLRVKIPLWCFDQAMYSIFRGLALMRDLTGDRVDDTIDLFDSYRIESSVGKISSCTRVGCSQEEKKATFLITVQNMDGKMWEGSAMKFSVNEFLYGKGKYDEQLTKIDITNMPELTELQYDVNIRGASGDLDKIRIENSGYLIKEISQCFSQIEGVTVMAYGFVDGKLRFQLYFDDILETDNHGSIYLKDENGEKIYPYVSVAFWDEECRGSYDEEFFDISLTDEKKIVL